MFFTPVCSHRPHYPEFIEPLYAKYFH
jgi:hypothetical protein